MKMEKSKNRLEVCLSPAIYDKHADDHNLVVIVDILRATSSICAAIHNGVKSIIPVATVEEARAMKQQGYMVASERDGYVPNVVYSCGALIHNETLVLPYGCSDASVRFAFIDLSDLLAGLRGNTDKIAVVTS